MSAPAPDSLEKRSRRRIGTWLCGRYRVLRLIGVGGMAAVYAGVHRNGHSVAIKVLHERLSSDPEIERLFRREAHLANKIQHPGVVPVIDDDVSDDGCVFLVMPLLEGETVRTRARRVEGNRLPLGEVVAVAHAALEVLTAAHALKIVHRDIKPENIFVSRTGQIHVFDFGIARFFEANESASMTRSGRTMGTPAYMAPEQALGKVREVDGQSDLWSVGATMFSLFAGKYVHVAETTGELLVVAATRKARPLVEVAPDVPEELRALVDRALAFDKSERWPDAASMLEALSRACEAALGVAPGKLPPLEVPAAAAPPDLGADGSTSGAGEGRPEDIHDAPTEHTGGSLAFRTTAAVESARGGTLSRSGRMAAAEGPRRKFFKSAWMPAVIALVVAAVVPGVVYLRDARTPKAAAVSPLAAANSVLACPIFEASGVPAPAGWLGAAAAATACERARVILGGDSARTLVPAELLSIPGQPVDNADETPFTAADSRERSLTAARQRAAAYLDGQVVKESSGFRTVLVMHRADGTEMGRGEGRGRALYQGVRQAMDGLIAANLLPKATALDPVYAEWSRATDVDSALALVDFTLAAAQNAGTAPDECTRLAARSASIGEMALLDTWHCAFLQGFEPPKMTLPPFDESVSPGALAARARFQNMALNTDDPRVITLLRKYLKDEQSPLGRSVLAATLSCSVQGSEPKEAVDLARLAVRADPKNSLGEFCQPWGQLLSVTTDTASSKSVIWGRATWLPWFAPAWLVTDDPHIDPRADPSGARRAYVLSPSNAFVTDVLAGNLLARGALEEVRNMALEIRATRTPIGDAESALLELRVDASEARFGASLDEAMRAMVPEPNDAGWVRVQRLDIAWRALEVARILGRAREIADLIVERFLDPELSPLDGRSVNASLRIPAICVEASTTVSKRCFARFHALRGRLVGGIISETDAFVAGVERYARGDLQGAAKLWRPLLREPGLAAETLSAIMETTFERTGDSELVERLEAAQMAAATNEYNGASLVHVRAALRAAKRGDAARARTLATKVIRAWSVADQPVPAVAEMRKLLTTLR